MIKWREKFEHGLGVIQKGLGVYNTIKGVYTRLAKQSLP